MPPGTSPEPLLLDNLNSPSLSPSLSFSDAGIRLPTHQSLLESHWKPTPRSIADHQSNEGKVIDFFEIKSGFLIVRLEPG